jgi:hypothetical protein
MLHNCLKYTIISSLILMTSCKKENDRDKKYESMMATFYTYPAANMISCEGLSMIKPHKFEYIIEHTKFTFSGLHTMKYNGKAVHTMSKCLGHVNQQAREHFVKMEKRKIIEKAAKAKVIVEYKNKKMQTWISIEGQQTIDILYDLKERKEIHHK